MQCRCLLTVLCRPEADRHGSRTAGPFQHVNKICHDPPTLWANEPDLFVEVCGVSNKLTVLQHLHSLWPQSSAGYLRSPLQRMSSMCFANAPLPLPESRKSKCRLPCTTTTQARQSTSRARKNPVALRQQCKRTGHDQPDEKSPRSGPCDDKLNQEGADPHALRRSS